VKEMKWLFKLIVVMLFLGATLVAVGLFMGIDIDGLQNYLSDNESFGEQIEYITETEIQEINFDLDTRDVVFYLTDEDHIRILYYEKDSDTWTISESSGVFYVDQDEKPRAWFFFRFPARTYRQVEVHVPKDLSLDLKIKTKTGTIKVEFTEFQNYGVVSLESNTGSIHASKINATRLNAKTDTGSVNLTNVDVEQAVTINSSTGSVNAKFVNADQLTMRTSTGSAKLEDSIIVNQAKLTVSTGSIQVSRSTASNFELISSTGDISFTIVNQVSYAYDLTVSTGSVRVLGNNQGKSHRTNDGDIEVYAKTSTGNIRILP
jgi:hypothetical protein